MLAPTKPSAPSWKWPTLWEVLVCVAIIAILVALFVPAWSKVSSKKVEGVSLNEWGNRLREETDPDKRKKALDVLLMTLQHEDPNFRDDAITGLRIAGDSHPYVTIVVSKLLVMTREDKDQKIRAIAAESLGRFPKQKATTIPILKDLLNDPEECVRQGARWGLVELEKPEAAQPAQQPK